MIGQTLLVYHFIKERKELKMEKLTCAQAKEIDLVNLLSNLGYRPETIKNNDYWYRSPLRKERTPSFKVNRKLNVWFDHGSGLGGTLIDFGLLYFNCSVSNLLERLTTMGIVSNLSFHAQENTHTFAGEKKNPNSGKIIIEAVRPLADNSLTDFLENRLIDTTIAKQFCKEIDFSLYGRKHMAIGFANRSSGYELRSDYFKGSSSPKDITLIEKTPGRKIISVLEGATDFLSLLTLRPELLPGNFLILNSLSFVNRSLDILKDFESVRLYLDHDTAGRNATELFKGALHHAVDHSMFYRQHKDLNDYLRGNKLSENQKKDQVIKDRYKYKQGYEENKQAQHKSGQVHYRRKI